MTLILVTYDVSTVTAAGRKRLRRVAKVCENYGQRVQDSVFECWIDNAQFVALRRLLLVEIDCAADSLRFYFLGEKWHGRVEHAGVKASYEADGPLIV